MTRPTACIVILMVLSLAPQLPAQATRASEAPPTTPPTAVTPPGTAMARRALIISVDGVRPDVLLRADAPRIDALCRNGAFSFWARTTAISITLPSHVSLLTGCIPEVHGILWNDRMPFKADVYPKVPTLFELAKARGYTTAVVAGKWKFDVLGKPGTIDHAYYPEESKTNDADVTKQAVAIIRAHTPDVMFVHLPGPDTAGHAKGWGSPEQLASIAVADGCVGEMIDALAERKVLGDTVIVITTDHGGAGRKHGADDPRSRHIPWIIAGPGIRKNHDLTMNRELIIDVQDTFPTVCKMLDIPVKRAVDGKVIEDAFAERELVRPAN